MIEEGGGWEGRRRAETVGSGDKDSYAPAAGGVSVSSEGTQVGLHGLSSPATSGTWKRP